MPAEPSTVPRRAVWFVRHGESEANVAGVLQGQTPGALTSRGRHAAELLGEHLAKLPHGERPIRIVSSDLGRAFATAEIIGSHLDLRPTALELAREWNVGILDGAPASALAEAVARSGGAPWELVPQDGESLLQVRERSAALLEQFRVLDGTTLCVSHGDFIRMALGVAGSMTIERAMGISLRNTSISRIAGEESGWVLGEIDHAPHLASTEMRDAS